MARASWSSYTAGSTNTGNAAGCQERSCGLSKKAVVMLNIVATEPGMCDTGAGWESELPRRLRGATGTAHATLLQALWGEELHGVGASSSPCPVPVGHRDGAGPWVGTAWWHCCGPGAGELG